ncbi:MAG: hypothetical protein AAGB19_09325 [Cyanobacteria bacterium P01_F01_bin.3]
MLRPIAIAALLLVMTACQSTPPTPEAEPETVTPESAADSQPVAETEADTEAAAPAELTDAEKFALFQASMNSVDPNSALILTVESPADGTAQIIVDEPAWDLVGVDERQEFLQAWYDSWTGIYGVDGRLEIVAENEKGRYQVGGSKRDGQPSELFLYTE